jgi:flavin reductase (DIM6/NTAB) family NADH-FMN oxidoreductase RutF
MRKEVTPVSVFAETLAKMKGPGVILLAGDPANPMTIGWGTIGYIWGKWVFTVLVRPSRHTHSLMESSQDFTVNVLPDDFAEQLAFCGRKSGRDTDKVDRCGFILEPGIKVDASFIAGSAIHFECRMLQKNELLPATLDPAVTGRYYPEKDFHTVYYGEIVGVFRESD